ncbi:MAG TPA: hypothetical protein VG479_01550 [Gaiellaceae bacterium]|nr:hypothetical protein [Gaiellaceae bacterium]
MIVRLMGEGQFELGDELLSTLNEIDDRAMAAADAKDEPELGRLLEDMWKLVLAEGRRLPDDALGVSDVVIPPSDLTLDETTRLFSEQGLIPDPPA